MKRPDTERKSKNMPRTNIPAVLTSFVGRKREIAEIPQLLGSTHMVSLVGTGGCGKTRLALRVAAELTDQYIGGVYWVELARLVDSTLVPQVVAKVMNVVEQSGTPLMDTLLDSLCDMQTLLVLDNCEHLLGACAQLVEALAGCPNISVLATSREPLGVIGETLYPVFPLPLPAAHLSVDEIRHVDSVQLFVERARSILPTFGLTPDNAEIVSTICRDLDGIPLAIELASARVSVLSVKQIQERLDRRFDLLVSTTRADDRHRTLRAAIDWSYDLLSPSERLLLQRLAVFTAGFALSTAESACAWGEIQRAEVLNLLSSLVSKSLVVAETLQGSEARYRLLETIRQYAQEKLKASGEWDSAHDHYLDCFLQLTEGIAPKLREQYQQLWFNWLEIEHDNIRAAQAWALENGRIETSLRIANALYQFWAVRNYWQEGLAWFERLLAQADDRIPVAIHANACTYAAFLAEWRGNSPVAIKYGRRGVELGEAVGDEGKPILGFALGGLASAMRLAGDYQAVFTIGEQYIELFRGLGDSYFYHLGMGVLVQGQMAITLGKYDTARNLLDEALTLARDSGDPYRNAMALNLLGDLARCERQYAQAQTLYEESAALLRELGAERDLAATLHNLGHTTLHLGDAERAQALFEESIAIQQAQQNAAGMAECLIGFAALAIARGLPAASARLLAALASTDWERRAEEWPTTRMEYEQTLTLARAQLTDAEFPTEQAAGRILTLEQAVEFARHLPIPPKTLPAPKEKLGDLTEREREVAALIAQGLSNGEIAGKLVLSKRTVEHHIANILSKLGFTHRAQIVRWAMENGLARASK